MEQTSKGEKRRFVRVDMTVPVKYRSFRNDSIFQGNFSVGKSRDISVSGLKWAVGKQNAVNTKLDMELVLSDTLSVYVIGKVVGGEDKTINGIVHRFDRVTFLEVDKDVQQVLTRQVFDALRRRGAHR